MRFFSRLLTARRVVSNLLTTRRNRRELATQLAKTRPPASHSIRIAVYFADTSENLYQIRQWYAPLAELSKAHPVAIICRSPGTMLAVMAEAPVPSVYVRSVLELERFVTDQPIRLVFYVNQNSKNFQMFRYSRMWHVFINHGESDKMYMTTNQYKAYDYALIAGDAAKERLGRTLWNYDVERSTIAIGRPQADHFGGEIPFAPDDRTVVLYAPTWEGDRPAAAYGSIASHGEALVGALLASGRHRVIYRPHPRSGVVDRGYAAAHARIVAAIDRANSADSGAHHVHDDQPSLGWQVTAADVAITDISAMVYDRLATGRPLLVTRPASPGAEIDTSGYLSACEWLTADEAARVIPAIDRVLTSDASHERLHYWVDRYFGDIAPGAATARFHGAVETLMGEWERAARAHAHDRITSESNPFDADSDEDALPGLS
jgi:hypothetical protein